MPKDGERYVENPDFVWVESASMWLRAKWIEFTTDELHDLYHGIITVLKREIDNPGFDRRDGFENIQCQIFNELSRRIWPINGNTPAPSLSSSLKGTV